MSLHLSTSEFIKDPTSVLDYTFDWTSWLGASENITSSAIVITPASHANNITLDNKTATKLQNDKIQRLNVNFSNFVSVNILEQTLF